MNLRKITIGTIACSALLFASCSKSLSYKEAREFVKTHYTHEGTIIPTSGKMKIDFDATKDENMRAILIFTFKLMFQQESLKFEIDTPKEMLNEMKYMNEKNFPTEDECTKTNTTFSVKGDELKMTSDAEKLLGLEWKGMKQVVTFNKEGAPYSEIAECKDVVSVDGAGPINGTIEMLFNF